VTSRATVVPLLLSGAATIIEAVPDVGPVSTRWGPVVPKRSTISDRFRSVIGGVQVFRGVVVEVGQPLVRGSITAVYAGGGFTAVDIYTLHVTVFDGAIDTDAAYDAALSRAMAVSDELETTWSYAGLAISQVDPPEIASFDLGQVAGANAWICEMDVRVSVERSVAATLV